MPLSPTLPIALFGERPPSSASLKRHCRGDLCRRRSSLPRKLSYVCLWSWTLAPGSRLDADHPETGSLFHAETQVSLVVAPERL